MGAITNRMRKNHQRQIDNDNPQPEEVPRETEEPEATVTEEVVKAAVVLNETE